jgi:hypothetical protein
MTHKIPFRYTSNGANLYSFLCSFTGRLDWLPHDTEGQQVIISKEGKLSEAEEFVRMGL